MTRLMLLLACASLPAVAQPPVVVRGELLPSIRVSYADLDLAEPSDVMRLHTRVRGAARSLCFDSTRGPIRMEVIERTCFVAALEAAIHDIDGVVSNRPGSNIAATAQTIVVSAH